DADLLENDFGEVAGARLSGSVYVDANNNGARDSGEGPIAGGAITLKGMDDTGAAVSRTATTALDGSYAFAGLRPGTYPIAEAQPATFLDGKDAAGAAGGIVGDDAVSDIALAPGADAGGYTFGELAPSRLSGSVYADANQSGAKDPGEAPLAG